MMSLSQAPNSKNIILHNSTAGSFSDFEVLTAVIVKIDLAWNVRWCSLEEVWGRFRASCSFHHMYCCLGETPWHLHQGIYHGDAWSWYTSAVSEHF